MKTVNVKIAGISPLLVHRFITEKQEKVAKKDKQYDPKEDADKALYKDEKGCYIPATWIEATMREAAKNFKSGKGTQKNTILSSVMVNEDRIYLDKQTYDEIDSRPVVVQRARIVRSRPKFNKWNLEFNISYDDDRISADTVKNILQEAGSCKGLGDYRPRFGRFKIENFEVK